MRIKEFFSIFLSVILSVTFVAVSVYAATTIGTNIDTGGTLAVTGLSTLGNASSTQLTATNSVYLATTGGSVGVGTTTPTSLFSFHGNSLLSGTAFFGAAITATSTLNVTGLTTLGNASTTVLSVSGASYFSTASTTGLATISSMKVSSIGDTVSDIQFGTCTVTIGSVTASSTAIATCAATGVTTSHRVFVTPYITDPQILFSSASSTDNDVIQIAVYNVAATAGAINPADNVWSWMAIK